MVGDNPKLPQFALIKQYLRGRIESGDWPVGARTPSENQLAAMFSVSRMTARRAVQELADEGLLTRAPGSGSFVAQPEVSRPQIEILDPLIRVQHKGTYSNRLLALESFDASETIANLLKLDAGTRLYRLSLVHLDADKPVQWQQWHINPSLAPALPKQTFNKITPQAYLDWLCPCTSREHQLEAVLPSPTQRRELALTQDGTAVCMQLTQRCWSQQQVQSLSVSLYPAGVFKLGSELNPLRSLL